MLLARNAAKGEEESRPFLSFILLFKFADRQVVDWSARLDFAFWLKRSQFVRVTTNAVRILWTTKASNSCSNALSSFFEDFNKIVRFKVYHKGLWDTAESPLSHIECSWLYPFTFCWTLMLSWVTSLFLTETDFKAQPYRLQWPVDTEVTGLIYWWFITDVSTRSFLTTRELNKFFLLSRMSHRCCFPGKSEVIGLASN